MDYIPSFKTPWIESADALIIMTFWTWCIIIIIEIYKHRNLTRIAKVWATMSFFRTQHNNVLVTFVRRADARHADACAGWRPVGGVRPTCRWGRPRSRWWWGCRGYSRPSPDCSPPSGRAAVACWRWTSAGSCRSPDTARRPWERGTVL